MLPLEGSAGYEEKTTGTNTGSSEVEYNEDNIRHLDDMEHIRVRSGMYIGRLGDGSQNDDGIYVLLKEVMDNSIDEFKMGAGTDTDMLHVVATMDEAFRKESW